MNRAEAVVVALADLKRMPLGEVEKLHREGRISQDVFEAYLHLWQTSAPRFAVQACHCLECLRVGIIA